MIYFRILLKFIHQFLSLLRKSTLMSIKQETSANYLKTNTIIFFALLIGVLLFTLNVGIINGFSMTTEIDFLHYIALPLAIVVPFIGKFVANFMLNKAKAKPSLAEKAIIYRSQFIVRLATIEGPMLFCVVVALLTNSIISLAIAAVLIVLFLLNKPSVEKMIFDLELSQDEISTLNNPNEILVG